MSCDDRRPRPGKMHSNKARKFSSQLVLEYLEEVLHLEGPVLRQVGAVDGVLVDRLAEARPQRVGPGDTGQLGVGGADQLAKPRYGRVLVRRIAGGGALPAGDLEGYARSRGELFHHALKRKLPQLVIVMFGGLWSWYICLRISLG